MNNKLFIAIEIIVFTLFVALGIAYISYDRSEIGRRPSPNIDRYLITINDKVLKRAFNKDNDWIKVIDDSKRKLYVCTGENEEKYKEKMLGKDSLAICTINESPNHGFDWKVVEKYGLCFSLPREKINETDGNDYDYVPTWLITTLIDEGILNIEDTLNDN